MIRDEELAKQDSLLSPFELTMIRNELVGEIMSLQKKGESLLKRRKRNPYCFLMPISASYL